MRLSAHLLLLFAVYLPYRVGIINFSPFPEFISASFVRNKLRNKLFVTERKTISLP
jgi:hypothetical protein